MKSRRKRLRFAEKKAEISIRVAAKAMRERDAALLELKHSQKQVHKAWDRIHELEGNPNIVLSKGIPDEEEAHHEEEQDKAELEAATFEDRHGPAD